MKYTIDCGHCLTGFDTGAGGNGYREEQLTRIVGNKVITKLEKLGHEVINCTVDEANSINDSLKARYTKSNTNKVDMFISIHLNASNGQGHGTEVFTYGAREIKEARNILNNIVALGYTNRGIKDGQGLAVIKHTDATAMLIECCFIDNAADMKLFDADRISDAIVNGLTGQTIKVATQKVNYCLEFQKWYNKTTQTAKPLYEDGIYGGQTLNALNTIENLIKGGK